MPEITQPIKLIKQATEREFATQFADGTYRDLGVICVRPIGGTHCNYTDIRGDQTWSQHAYGNAWDIGGKAATPGGPRVPLDDLYDWLKEQERLGGHTLISEILWRQKDHWDHIHITGKPKWSGHPLRDAGAGEPGVIDEAIDGLNPMDDIKNFLERGLIIGAGIVAGALAIAIIVAETKGTVVSNVVGKVAGKVRK